MNPIAWAVGANAPENQVIDLFLHATRAGVLDFAWGVLCAGCSAFRTSNAGLRSLSDRAECAMCLLPNGGAVGDDVEVAFTVNPAIRHIRFHDPDSLDWQHDGPWMFPSRFAGRGPGVAAAMESQQIAAGRVPGGQAHEQKLRLPPGHWFLLAPEIHSGVRFEARAGGADTASIEISSGRVNATNDVGAGDITLRIRNRDARTAGWMLLPDPKASKAMRNIPPTDLPFLTGQRLIASQTFRDLFRTESIPHEIGLEVRSLSVLLTDLKGSTQMYERIGDLRAFELVRQHFDVLRTIVVEHGGAMVKTIGDAVMATFHEPAPALSAAIAMHDRVSKVGAGELLLKIGLHDGPCIAVELNDRLDFFGQTVNIAARVQALADAGEIVLTEHAFRARGVGAIVDTAKLKATHGLEPLKGIEQPVPVVRLNG